MTDTPQDLADVVQDGFCYHERDPHQAEAALDALLVLVEDERQRAATYEARRQEVQRQLEEMRRERDKLREQLARAYPWSRAEAAEREVKRLQEALLAASEVVVDEDATGVAEIAAIVRAALEEK